MGNQKKEITVGLNIKAKLDDTVSQIKSVQSQLANFELPKGIASEFAKEFKGIEKEITELQRLTASGDVNLIDANAAEKAIEKIEKRWGYLLSKIGGESFLGAGLKTDVQALSALETIQKNYTKGVKEAENYQAKLSKRIEEAKQNELDVLEAQKKQKVVKAAQLDDAKAQVVLAEKEEARAKKIRDEAEKALRVKVAETKDASGKQKYSMEEAGQKGSNLRKTAEYRAFRDAQAAYDTAKTNTKSKQKEAGSMVTKEMQAAEAQEAKKAIEEATTALEKYQSTSLETAKTDAFEKAKESLSKMAEFQDIDWEGLDIDLSNVKSIEDLEKALAKLRQEAGGRTTKAVEGMEKTVEDASEEFEGLGKDVKVAKESLQQFNEESRQVEDFENKVKQFLGMAGAVELFRRALRSAFETTKELDAAMGEMAVVTELDVGDYWEQLPEHTERASELGVAIQEVYKAETLYYQQGLKTNEVIGMSTETLKMARIAGLSAEDATNKMTAALRGFNMELNETSAQKVADVYSELAAITASDVNEISSAMTKTASIASSAGMEFETTAAFLSQIIETTRESAETAGTALKTVIARFQELKKDPAEIGEVDGEIVDANKIETALRSVGVSLRDASGQFRDLDDVFLELSGKWDSLDTNTQRYIATIAAGSRQQSRFIAMMSDYHRTQELVSAANDSAGASQKQYEKTLETLETKLANLKNAWDEFSMGILQSDLVKAGVDILTKFLEIINKATSAFDGLGGTITKVLTTIVLFKIGQKVFDKLKQPLMNFFTGIVKEMYNQGYEAGKQFAEGTKAAKEEVEKQNEQKTDEKSKQEDETQPPQEQKKPDTRGTLARLTKFDEEKYETNKAKGEKAKQELDAMTEKGGGKKERKRNVQDKRKSLQKTKKDKGKESPEYKQQEQELLGAEKELEEYENKQKEVMEAAQQQWGAVGESVKQAGSAIAGVGVGVSLLGGFLSSIGLEEFGEGVSWVGNAMMFAGTAISMIGSLIPVVAKVAVAAGISVQAAWWWLVLIVAAVVAFGVALYAVFKNAQANSFEARMKAAEEAAASAREEAEAAEKAYEDLLSAKSGYEELQSQLDNLTKGTDEWKEALRKANNQVLELLSTYPELVNYITKGANGELEISNAGWDMMIEQQQQGVKNAQGAAMTAQLKVDELKLEGAAQDYTKASTVYRYNDNGVDYAATEAASSKLREDLEQIYLVAGSSLDDMEGKAEELAKTHGVTVDFIEKAAKELENSAVEMKAISEQSEATARAYLTSMASEDMAENKFGDQAVDAFANSVNSEATQTAIEDQVAKLDNTKDFKDSEEFDRIAKEYGVDQEMTGDDLHDVQTLYAKMKGLESVDDIPDAIAENEEKMIQEIATMDQNNQLVQKMKDYADKLEAIAASDKTKATNIAGLLSDEGKGMTRDFSESFMNGEEFDRTKVDSLATEMGDSVDQWAEAVGKTTEELYDEIEENVRSAITINTATFTKLNKVLKTNGKEIDKFGKNVALSTEVQSALSEKIVGAVQIAGTEGGTELKELLDNALETAGEDAEDLGKVLGSMNWNSADDWKELPDLLDSMGIIVSDDIQNLINKAQELGIAVETVNIDKVTSSIQELNNLMKSIQSGEQGRSFSEESYNLLIKSNADLADRFVQIGDQFHYLGGSMDELAFELKKSAAREAALAAYQVESQVEVADAVRGFEKTGASFGGKKLELSDGNYTNWGRTEQIAYLEQFREYAKNTGVDTLQYVTNDQGESLGLSLGTNFNDLTDAALEEALTQLRNLDIDYDKLTEEQAKKVSEARIATHVLNKADENVTQATALRTEAANAAETKDEKTAKQKEQQADEYAKAFSIQASESGIVAEAVIAEYNELIAKDFASMSDDERQKLTDLEKTMQSGLDLNAEKLEDLKTVNEMTQRVAEALQDIRQNEIDKLSTINDSINAANENLVSKIQEQIDDARQARENEKMEQDIAADQSQLAYLMADTSGAGALSAQALEKQITEKQENYQDNLIDQSLQKLSDDNAAAAEQRERQIALMEAQLNHDIESGNLMREAETITNQSLEAINNGVDPLETEMYNVLKEAEDINGGMATEGQQKAFNTAFAADAKKTADSFDTLNKTETNIDTNTDNTFNTAEAIETWLTREDTKYQQEQANKDKRATAAKEAAAIVASGGWVAAKASGSSVNKEYEKKKADYVAAGGNSNDFESMVTGAMSAEDLTETKTGTIGVGKYSHFNHGYFPGYLDPEGHAEGKYDGVWYSYKYSAEDSIQTDLNAIFPNVEDQTIVMYKGIPYIYSTQNFGGDWTANSKEGKRWKKIDQGKSSIMAKFETGGLADFTGPAWLDGTKSRPELVLNARDTQNFIQLKDILSEVMRDTDNINHNNTTSNGDNYFDININVEELKDDYDVEQLADKIRSMLYEDASYRNVNTVSLTR